MALENAKEGLNQRRIKWLSESDKVLQAMTELQEALNLPELPDRIECYDISHIQGTNAVGSMVVFEGGRPKPAHYRRFQIKTFEGNDDFASLQEVLRRRFRRLAEERKEQRDADDGSILPLTKGELEGVPSRPSGPSTADEPNRGPNTAEALGVRKVAEGRRQRARRYAATGALADDRAVTGERREAQSSFGLVPGLVIIDGGKGQLSSVQEIFLELGITDIPLCSLAKQEEEIFLPHMPEPVVLPRNSQGLYLVQRIRDEAHRFAITYHRQRRSKAATRSALDDAPGIGPKRKRELIKKFGSVEGIRNASLEDVASVPGMSLNSARKLAEHLGGAIADEVT
jgi:excinuclease ABC subunit C